MPKFTDQLGNNIVLEAPPQRIVSIVPSQSEFLWDIGLHHELVGITKFCVHPEKMFRSIERVGGTKKLDIEKIRRLKPDLIIGNTEENEQSQIELLSREFKVWMSDIYNFDDAYHMMLALGTLLDRELEAARIVNELKRKIPAVQNLFSSKKAAYFIWYKPYMLAGKNTFIDHVLSYIGLKNAAASLVRYPEIDKHKLKELDPDVCFLSSEPFPFRQKHMSELQAIMPNTKILIVDGEVFSWYGSRLLHLNEYLINLKEEIEG